MIKMNAKKCPKCGGPIFKLAGRLASVCHDECKRCREAQMTDEIRRAEAEEEAGSEERRQPENEEMERHFEKHPHG